ncbi:VCBS repeat-containing protein [Nocardia sp. NPDC051030]|uniref:FG-GAP repeat domain-containing protein n=1 Tax=Nocardia sp. NPDC051030 TaxID=3155162 RepID=UPI0034228A6B
MRTTYLAVAAVSAVAAGAFAPAAIATPVDSGSGTTSVPIFSDSVQYPVGGLGPTIVSQTMATGDFDRDGNLDLAATGVVDGVAILNGDGHGQLTRTAFYHTEIGTNSVVAADLRGLGRLDLVVTNFFSVSVLFNDGHGRFTVDRTYATDPNPTVTQRTGGVPVGAAVADFDGDGHPDLAINSLVPVPGGVGIMRNDGAGHFTGPAWYGVGLAKTVVQTGDIDNDGRPDLITSDAAASGFWVQLNDGHGGFEAPRWNFIPLLAEDMKVADVDGDGNLDVVTANAAAFSFSVQYGDGAGNFGPPQLTAGSFTPCALAIDDFDGDGITDIAVMQFVPSLAVIYRGNGHRGFEYTENHTIGLGGQGAITAQLDRTRQPSILSMSALSQDVSVLHNNTPTAR